MSLPTVVISSPGGETAADFVPGANLLCCSLRHHGEELLDPGHGVEAYAEQGKTMGIPLLYPWANRLSHAGYEVAGRMVTLPAGESGTRYPVDPNGLPIHGAIPGGIVWEAEANGDRLAAAVAWEADDLLELFPFRHRVSVEASVDESGLTLTTTVHADAGDPVPVAFGYHPYLRLPGSSREGWRVDLGATRRIVLDERMIPTGERVELAERDFLLGERSLDDGLADLMTPARFRVSDGERSLSASFGSGYDWAQVYAPPGHDFICFEPMTAPTDALNSHDGLRVLKPGEAHAARFRLAVTP
ncbi:MAG TPA: aldose 1-epimerase [Solirubrobacteraceae bacterium]|nr:aldose 1-epimerase [Solirubrobacteraceae bacterium]